MGPGSVPGNPVILKNVKRSFTNHLPGSLKKHKPVYNNGLMGLVRIM